MRHLLSRRGQMTVEMVLILAVLTATTYMVHQYFTTGDRTQKPAYQFVTGPWKTIAGMMESGKWMDKVSARAHHPNRWSRMYTEEEKD